MPGDDTINTRGYKAAGVDIDAGADLVEAIKPLTRGTARPGAMGTLGGFAGMFDLAAAGFRDPILVAATDGVGTKLKLAAAAGRHDGVGIDLVAMCVNDLVVAGAEPLFFLDYYASGHLDVAAAKAVIAGIAAGCGEAGCALIGGETAEMPGMYGAGDYDLAGFAVGAVERGKALTGAMVAPGDVVLGLASSGVHANGFSLVRRVIETAGLHPQDPAPFARERGLADALLVPTRIYVRSCLAALRSGAIKALAHITGGGLIENLPRVLPDGVTAEIDATAWTPPPVFTWLATAGAIAPDEMMRTFNCGIGMAVIVAPDRVAATRAIFAQSGETVHVIGRVAARRDGDPAIRLNGLEAAWRR